MKQALNSEKSFGFYLAMGLGLFFLGVSVMKFLNPQDFATAVFHGHIMPYPAVNSAALLFMSLELVASFSVLFLPQYRRAGLWILIGVLLIYTGCATANLLRDLNTVCGCFGSHARMAALSWWGVVRSLSLVGIALTALR